MVRYLIPLAVLGLASCTRTEPQDTAASPGALDGPYESYHPNGQLWSRGSYSNGFLSGPYEEYYENGQLEWKGYWSNDEKCGEWIEDGETITYPPCPNG